MPQIWLRQTNAVKRCRDAFVRFRELYFKPFCMNPHTFLPAIFAFVSRMISNETFHQTKAYSHRLRSAHCSERQAVEEHVFAADARNRPSLRGKQANPTVGRARGAPIKIAASVTPAI